MKNAFGATLLFQIVIFFVVLFTGYICLSINQAKAFNVKNEIVKAIERHAPNLEGVGLLGFSSDVKKILEDEGYRLEGDCSTDLDAATEVYGCTRNGVCSRFDKDDVAVCIGKYESPIAGSSQKAYYYKVETFYQLDIPIINSLFNLRAKGETKLIYKREGL